MLGNQEGGGGVGFYIKDDLSFKVMNMCPFIDSQFENIIIETTISRKKYYLCNIYRAPSTNENISQRDLIENYCNRLDNLLPLLSQHNHTALIFSDSNLNLLKLNTSPLTAEYLDVCHTNGFLLTNLKATRISQNSFSLIDHVLTNNISKNILSGSIVCDISDHFPVFFSCDNVKVEKKNEAQMTRNFNQESMSSFRDALRNLRWHNVLLENNVNVALDNFLDPFMTLFDLHFPLKKRKVNRNFDKLNAFMTKGLLISRRHKNLLYKKQLNNPSQANVTLFKNFRNIYNSVLRKSKKLYYEDSLNKFKLKPKKIWEILNSINGKTTKGVKIDEILNGDVSLNDDRDIAQSFNNFFTTVGTDIYNSIEPTLTDPLSYIPINNTVPNFVFNNTGPIHVIDIINSMQNICSADCNSISMKLVKFVAYEINVPLSHIFQLSLS
jgi:hypothetical protein